MFSVKYLLTECQKYEKNRINLSVTDNFDNTHGPNLEQNKKTLKLLKSNNLLNEIYCNINFN